MQPTHTDVAYEYETLLKQADALIEHLDWDAQRAAYRTLTATVICRHAPTSGADYYPRRNAALVAFIRSLAAEGSTTDADR